MKAPAYEAVIEIFYDEVENAFYDECGQRINNIFELVTPNDLYLYKSEATRYSSFFQRDDPRILCEIHDLEDPGDGYYNSRKDIYDEYECIETPCGIYPGVMCRFSGGEESPRREICYACSGGD